MAFKYIERDASDQVMVGMKRNIVGALAFIRNAAVEGIGGSVDRQINRNM